MTACLLDTCDRTAEAGFLCLDDYSKLRSQLVALPAVAGWLHVNIAAGGTAGERVSGSRDDPIPLRTDVLDLIGPDSSRYVPASAPVVLLWEDGVCIGLFDNWRDAVTARWSEIVAADGYDVDVHRWRVAVTDKRGCDQTGDESLRAVVDYWARRLWAEGGFPWPDCNDLTGLVAFLAGGLDWIAAQDWVGELVADVTRATRTAHRLVPWRAETRRDPDPCPRCSRPAVVLHLAAGESRCEKRAGGCGRRQPLSEYVLNAVLPQSRRAS